MQQLSKQNFKLLYTWWTDRTPYTHDLYQTIIVHLETMFPPDKVLIIAVKDKTKSAAAMNAAA